MPLIGFAVPAFIHLLEDAFLSNPHRGREDRDVRSFPRVFGFQHWTALDWLVHGSLQAFDPLDDVIVEKELSLRTDLNGFGGKQGRRTSQQHGGEGKDGLFHRVEFSDWK